MLVSGASGLIGSELVPALRARGHEVVRLVREGAVGRDTVRWDPALGAIDSAALEGFDGVIHLAGENIAVRWTAEARRRILESRSLGTRLLARALATLERPPAALVSASAIGIYGERGDELLTESSQTGEGFLPDVARAWEAAALPAAERGIRVVHPRLGLVLTPRGGALAPMLKTFRLGLGGPFGRGGAWWSWIALPDVLEILEAMLSDARMRGPINVVSPNPVQNASFTSTLGRVLHRPAILPVPPLALELLFGAMAKGTILASHRVAPERLTALGHRYRASELEPALRLVLANPAS